MSGSHDDASPSNETPAGVADDRLKDLLLDAIQRPKDERSGFLDRACDGDRDLLARVAALLHAHERAGGFLPDHADEATDRG